ncbi:hypothetical protein LTR64_001917 [Lithohypha guttulata]|uniref:uncharacterized protein n=1 Tax=Lithohypha guttulata TaxID=1690604 RepID=UPI00315D941A
MSQIKAICFKEGGGKAARCLELTTRPKPDPKADDLLVNIKACAVNPVDTKIRQGAFPAADITGYDAAGIVEKVGSNVTAFKPGDEVYYSGQLGQPGTTATYSLVNSKLAALKPKSLDFVDAAAVPLVSLTAWELFEEHFNLIEGDPQGKQAKKSILIINGAGGVGSIATQLARKVFKLERVVVTASRPETIEHAKKMGATDVISHREELKPQLEKLGLQAVEYIMICHSTISYMDVAVDIAAPTGKIGSIVEVSEPLPGLHKIDAFMKALSFHWEVMLSKGVYNYDLESQGDILKRVAKAYDDGLLTTLVVEQHTLSVKSLIAAHEKLEAGTSIGKIALTVGDDIQ